tara:strand:+ start:5987 stop:6289 length:303 start_codon:yes stop_codon:yes gene_type:complete
MGKEFMMNKYKELDDPLTTITLDTDDPVNNPFHYNEGDIECIDAMRAMADGATNVSAHEAYCWQNSFKYLWRWPYKNRVEDLKKCQWYLNRLIAELEDDN